MSTPPKRPIFSALVIAAMSLASPLFTPSAHANLVVNGDFETGVTQKRDFGGIAVGGGDTVLLEGTLAGWGTGPSGSAPNVLATNERVYYAASSDPAPVPPPGGPHAGAVSAVFPNPYPYDGYISQAIAGVVNGSAYRISFWLSNQIGDANNNSLAAHWGGTDTGNGISGGTDIFGPVALTVPLGWTQYSVDVVATENNQRLSFRAGNAAAGNLLDDVSVIAIPEVSSFGMLTGLSLLALGATARFRRRSVATA